MRRFTDLFRRLDETTRTTGKLAALVDYFTGVPAADGAWAVWFLAGNRPRRAVTTRQLREFVAEAAGLPAWLVEECYEAVGDLGETLALTLETAGVGSDAGNPLGLARFVEEHVLPVARADAVEARRRLLETWQGLSLRECFLFQKLIAGTFRVGVSKTLLTRALAEVAGLDRAVMARRLMGSFEPTPDVFRRLISDRSAADDRSRPYPFHLANPLETVPDELGAVDDWQVEWKWDGIRAQLLRRSDETVLWSRGEELIGEAFPEIVAAGELLPDGTAVDGELLAWRQDGPGSFAALQRRLGRRRVSPGMLREVPVIFMAYDLMEADGKDVRALAASERRKLLEELHARWRERFRTRASGGETMVQGDLFVPAAPPVDVSPQLSPVLRPGSWQDVADWVAEARQRRVEGVMLKRTDSAYGVGRERGGWWKWKVDPLTVDAVMVAAQQGHGRRASLFTDYTFALRDGEEFVAVAKAYSGLTDAEIAEVDGFVRANTLRRHGPVRGVKPELVFELAFEGVQSSSRHKSGIALRFPRIHRWRRDKPVAEIDTLDSLRRMAEAGGTK